MSNNYGFYISNISLRGRNKKSADLTFQQGLNVISGASDTGKTFIFECINFIFGGSSLPKKIEESEGYTEFYIELTGYDGDKLTLRRNLSDKKIFLYQCDLNDVKNMAPVEILPKHNKEDSNNISQILLDKSGAAYKNVIYKKAGHTQSFSFRDFVHIFMLHEKKILEASSPIYTGEAIQKTRNESVFRILMTGIDDSTFEDNKKSDSAKLKAKAQIEVMDDLILKVRVEIEEISANLKTDGFNESEFNCKLNFIKNELAEKTKAQNKYLEARQKLLNKLQAVKNDSFMITEINNRFNLLRKNYESDIERVDFIEEADYYLGQLVDVKCPVCNNYFGEVENNVEIAIGVELKKVRQQLKDLNLTIKENEEKIKEKEEHISLLSSEIKQIDDLLTQEFAPLVENFNSEIESLMLIRDNYKARELNSKRLKDLLNKRQQLQAISDDVKTEKVVDNELTPIILDTLCDIIKELLEKWKLEDKITISYNKKANDIVVNGKQKGSYGKGYASIINSAFVIGLMLYLIKLGLPHPKLVILDSPLTTYKDKAMGSKDSDKINEEVKQAFFSYLSTFTKGIQFLILDNVSPPKEIQEKIKFYHFTKNTNYGRYGFIELD